MLRVFFASLVLPLIAGCQATAPQMGSDLAASITPMELGPSMASLTLQDPSQDGEAPPPKQDPDPPGWVPVEQVDGKAVETVRRYYPSGRVARIFTRLKGTLGPRGHHGRDLFLYENGAWKQDSIWVDGQMSGPYKEWFEGGQRKVESAFKAGKRHGVFNEYGERGAHRIQGNYVDGVLHGEFRLWFGTGDPQESSHWDMGVQTGESRVWDRNRTPIVKEQFVGGKRHGLAIVYYRLPGEEKIFQSGEYRHGLKQGIWTEFDGEGVKIKEKEMVSDKVHGYLYEWRGGVQTLKTQFRDNVENGLRLEYFADGKPFSKGQMKDGAREGVWTYWEQDGSLQTKWSGVYSSGKKIGELPSAEKVEGGNSNE